MPSGANFEVLKIIDRPEGADTAGAAAYGGTWWGYGIGTAQSGGGGVGETRIDVDGIMYVGIFVGAARRRVPGLGRAGRVVMCSRVGSRAEMSGSSIRHCDTLLQ